MLCTTRDLFTGAEKNGYAVGAFNFANLEILQAIVQAAEETGSPAILAVSEGALKYGGFHNLLGLARTMAEYSDAALAIHLDHGRDRRTISRCISEGFTSVMFDGSDLPFEENIRQTREVVEEARPNGVSVEGELGRLVGSEDGVEVSERDAQLTDPVQAKQFVEETGVDSLAVAIGTSHGPYKFSGKARLDFERLEAIDELVEAPLVLHGASGVDGEAVNNARASGIDIGDARGVTDEAIREAIRLGIRKINIDTDMRLCFTTTLRSTLMNNSRDLDPRKILAPPREAVKQVVKAKMELFSNHRS
jgi:fructose-bisphosphate aldolase class II